MTFILGEISNRLYVHKDFYLYIFLIYIYVCVSVHLFMYADYIVNEQSLYLPKQKSSRTPSLWLHGESTIIPYITTAL